MNMNEVELLGKWYKILSKEYTFKNIWLYYRFQPPDACYIELMRFRVRPPKNRELPLQLKATWCVTGNRVSFYY